MSLHSNPHPARHRTWLTIAAAGIAVLASVQLISGSTPIIWLLAASVALGALLAQASQAEDSTPIPVRHSHYRPRSRHR
jgi:hypothetical protein